MGSLKTARAVALGLAPIAMACGFQTPGGGKASGAMLGDSGQAEGTEGTAASDGSSGNATGGATGGGPAGMDDDGVDPEPDSSGGGGSTGTGDDAPDGSTGGPPPDPCAPAPAVHEMIAVSAAVVGLPMTTAPHSSFGEIAYSGTQNAGTASFTFDAGECMQTVWVWALVYDQTPGSVVPLEGNADAFNVRIDGDADRLFGYGCYAWGEPPWSWQTVHDTVLCLFEDERVQFTVTPGNHTLHFTNVEAGTAVAGDYPGSVAAIAAIIVTSDPNYTP